MTVPVIFDFIVISLVVLIMGFIPGYLALSLFPSLKNYEKVAASFGISFLILFIISFIAFILNIGQSPINLYGLAVIVAVLLFIIWRKKIRIQAGKDIVLLSLIFIGVYAHLISSQAITPLYTGGFMYKDWFTHYASSLFYLNNGDISATGNAADYFSNYLPITRPPMYNFVVAFFMSIFGDSFWIYQIAGTLMNATTVLSAYLLARVLFSEKTAIIASGFFFFNPFILREDIFTWQKPVATYMVLLSLYFYLKIRNENHTKVDIILFGLFSGLAGLSHQFTYLYLAGILLDYLLVIKSRKKMPSRAALLAFGIPFMAVLLPYYAWASQTYGLTSTILANPSIIRTYSIQFSILIGLWNLVLNIVPLELGYYTIRSILEWNLFSLKLLDSILSYYLNTVEGALTTTISIILIARFRKDIVSSMKFPGDRKRTIILFAAAGYFGGSMVLIYLQNHGVVSNIGMPLILLLLIYSVDRFAGLSVRLKNIVLCGIFIEFMLTAWVQLMFFYAGLRELPVDGNYLLKIKYSTVYAWDYLGSSWVYFVIPALLIEVIFFIFLYRNFTRKPVN